MMKKYTIYILMVLFCSMPVFAADDVTEAAVDAVDQLPRIEADATITKAMADSAYIRNEYATAIQMYEALLQQGTAAEVYYNLGNAYFKADNIAKAIVNYERALLLEPNNGDFKANLTIARAKIVDKYEAPTELFLVSWGKWIVNTMTSNQWAVLSMIIFVLFLGSLGTLILYKRGHIKRIALIVTVVMLVLTPITVFCASYQKTQYFTREAAIVIEPSVVVRSTPSESGTSLFVLHEGKRVEIKDNSMSSWKEIRLENGEVGWLPIEAIEVI